MSLHTDSDTSKNTKATFKSCCWLLCRVRTVYNSLNSSIHHVNKSSDKSSEYDMWMGDNNNNTSSPFTLWNDFVNVQYTAFTEILAHARWTAVRDLPEVGRGGGGGLRIEGAVGIVSCWPNA